MGGGIGPAFSLDVSPSPTSIQSSSTLPPASIGDGVDFSHPYPPPPPPLHRRESASSALGDLHSLQLSAAPSLAHHDPLHSSFPVLSSSSSSSTFSLPHLGYGSAPATGITGFPPVAPSLPSVAPPPPPPQRPFDVGELRIDHVASRSTFPSTFPPPPLSLPSSYAPTANPAIHDLYHQQQLQQQHPQHSVYDRGLSFGQSTYPNPGVDVSNQNLALKRERFFEHNSMSSNHYPYDSM